jgi:hypothetical protein
MTRTATGIVLAALVVAVIAWDAVLAVSGSSTISECVWAWSKDTPLIPFATGLLCGHLWWRK